jgi:predicted phage terminase large subunit-like protein
MAASAPTAKYPNPDWAASVLWAYMRNGTYAICDVQRMRGEPGAVDGWIAGIVRTDGSKVVQAIWQDPAVGGKYLAAHMVHIMRKALPTCTVTERVEKLDKIAYASIWSAAIDPRPRLNQQVCALLRGPWNNAFMAEIEAFPSKDAKKDQVDAASRAFLEIHETKEFGANPEDFHRAMQSIDI